jgi:hypothetical protein
MAGARKDPFKDSESKEVLPTGYMQEVLPANDAMEELPANDMKEVLPVNDMKLSKEDEISFRLTEQRRQKLEEIGFVWSVRESDAKTDQNRMTRNSYDDLWDKMYERLKVYKDRYGVGQRGESFACMSGSILTFFSFCRIAWYQSAVKTTRSLAPG